MGVCDIDNQPPVIRPALYLQATTAGWIGLQGYHVINHDVIKIWRA